MDIYVISMPSPSFDWYQLIYSIISGGVAVGAFWLVDYFRNKRHEERYSENLLIFILLELHYNFFIVVNTLRDNEKKKNPIQFKFNNWDENKTKVAEWISQKLIGELEINFHMSKLMNNNAYNEIKKEQIINFLNISKDNIESLIHLIKHKNYYLNNLHSDVKNFDIKLFD